MTDYAAVLNADYPGASWSLNGDTYDGLVWHDDSPMPSQADLDAAWPRVEAELVNADAAAAREVAYKVEADPLFFYWQAGEGDEQVWLAKRAEIRARHPYVEVPS